MAGTFRSGKHGRVAVEGGGPLNLQEWSFKDHGDNLDTTNFEDLGFGRGLVGVREADWSFKGNWDVARNFSANPPGLFPRDDGLLMTLYPRTSDAKFITINEWRCLESTITTTTRGLVTFDTSGMTNGPYLLIQGTV